MHTINIRRILVNNSKILYNSRAKENNSKTYALLFYNENYAHLIKQLFLQETLFLSVYEILNIRITREDKSSLNPCQLGLVRTF